jgi:hypothetical protein
MGFTEAQRDDPNK